jgi:hypothetical protein
MKTLKITFVLLFLSTIAFSQSDKKVMLSDKVKEVMIEDYKFNYDSILRVLSEKDTGQYIGKLPADYKKYACYLPANHKPILPVIVLDNEFIDIVDLEEVELKPQNHEIEVVSGIKAAALFGSRGGTNGVIYITTAEYREKEEKRLKKYKRKKKD